MSMSNCGKSNSNSHHLKNDTTSSLDHCQGSFPETKINDHDVLTNKYIDENNTKNTQTLIEKIN